MVDYLEFGLPQSIDYSSSKYKKDVQIHKSALLYPEAVEEYLEVEVTHKAIVIPFSEPLFLGLHVSPMMTQPKHDNFRRLIVDLSWPHRTSVNDNIPDAQYAF